MRRTARATLPLFGSLAILLGGCSEHAPTGQVIASIAGEDVSRRDLAAELAAGDISVRSAADMRGPLLQRIVDRKLLVRAAKRQGLDHTPDYLAAIRRNRDLELTRLLSNQLARSLPAPSEPMIAAYLAAHHEADRAAAVTALQQHQLGVALARMIERERQAVQIRYQTGFGPAAE